MQFLPILIMKMMTKTKKKSSTRNHLIHLGEKYMIDLKNFKNLNMMLESGSYGSLYLV